MLSDAAIIEMTAGTIAQFLVGRCVIYVAVGFVEVSVATYQAELCPAGMRAFVVASLQFFLVAGGLVASGVNKAYSMGTDNASWQIPVGFTFIFPTIILVLLPFLPDAPRWLLFKGKREQAIKTLQRVRPQSDVDSGMCEAEIDAISEAMSVEKVKLPWVTLLRGTNLRRTVLCCLVFVLQQFTGQAFTSQYATIL